MEVPLRVGLAIGGALMKSLSVRESDLKQVIVTCGHALEDVSESGALTVRESGKRPDVPLRQHHRLERPDRPKWNERAEVSILGDQSFTAAQLEGQIVASRQEPCVAE